MYAVHIDVALCFVFSQYDQLLSSYPTLVVPLFYLFYCNVCLSSVRLLIDSSDSQPSRDSDQMLLSFCISFEFETVDLMHKSLAVLKSLLLITCVSVERWNFRDNFTEQNIVCVVWESEQCYVLDRSDKACQDDGYAGHLWGHTAPSVFDH